MRVFWRRRQIEPLPSPAVNVDEAPPEHLARWLIGALSWTYFVAVLMVWVFLRAAGDRWWIATLLLFGHRWVWALPLVLLLPAAGLFRRRSMRVLIVSALIVIFPIMGLCLPWHRVLPASSGGIAIRVLTCNAHAGAISEGGLKELITQSLPDVVALQEWDSNTSAMFSDGSWHVRTESELCIASRYPIRKVQDVVTGGAWGNGWATRYELSTPAGLVQFYNLHLSSPHGVFRAALHLAPNASDLVMSNSRSRMTESIRLVADARTAHTPVLMAGDFNTPCDSYIYGKTMHEYSDAFSTAGFGFGWTYRVQGTLTRIDHILYSKEFECTQSWVGPDIGSTHRPVLAVFNLKPASTAH